MTHSISDTQNMPDTLTGLPLTLRPLRLNDAANFAQYASDQDIARMTGSFPRFFPLISAEFRIMHMNAQKRGGLSFNYAITQTGQDPLIGVMDLFRPASDEILEIGYWIAKPFWGKGYATEAGRMILEAAQEHLGVKRIKASVYTDNPASLRVLEKLGFEKFGPIQSHFSMARLEKAPCISLRLDMEQSAIMQGLKTCANAAHTASLQS